MNRAEFLGSLTEVLDRAVVADDAGLGNIQRLAPGRTKLEIVAHHGFSESFLRFFKFVSAEDESACGRAYRLKARVAIPDVLTDPLFIPFTQVATDAGFRAVQSTPIMGPRGRVLGVLSTHFPNRHRLSRVARERLDACAQDAATLMVAYDHDRLDIRDGTSLGRMVAELVDRFRRDAEARFTDDERTSLWTYVRQTPILTDDEAKLLRRCSGSPWLQLG